MKSGCMQLWRSLTVLVLNGECLGRQGPLFPVCRSEPSKAQEQALDNITGLVERFVQNPFETREGKSLEPLVHSKGLDYGGRKLCMLSLSGLRRLSPVYLPRAMWVLWMPRRWRLVRCWIGFWTRCSDAASGSMAGSNTEGMNSTREEWHKVVQVLVKQGYSFPYKTRTSSCKGRAAFKRYFYHGKERCPSTWTNSGHPSNHELRTHQFYAMSDGWRSPNSQRFPVLRLEALCRVAPLHDLYVASARVARGMSGRSRNLCGIWSDTDGMDQCSFFVSTFAPALGFLLILRRRWGWTQVQSGEEIEPLGASLFG